MPDDTRELNLYASPEAVAVVTDAAISSGALTETMISHLKAAAPWLRFLGILGFIGAGFMVMTGIISAIAMGVAGTQLFEEFSEAADGVFGTVVSFFSGFLGIIYIGFGVIYFFSALFTYQFGNKLRSYLRSNNTKDLEAALRNNKSLWKFKGILAIIELAAIPVILVITIVVAITAAAVA
jgi:hypothetical protein